MEAAELLAAAFEGDPAFVATWPDPARRRRALRFVERCNLRLHRAVGRVDLRRAGGRLVGVALWRPPGVLPGPWRQALAGFWATPLRCGPGATRRLARLGEAIEACYRAEPGRWTLDSIAVDPAAWGRGHGRALLAEGIARAGADGVSLVTTWPRNRRFYEAAGFRLVATRPAPGGVQVLHFVRPGAAPAAP